MRKFFSVLIVLIVIALGVPAVGWAVFGERVVSRLDQYRTVDESSVAVRRIQYMGDGTGGPLWVDIGEKELALFNLTPGDSGMAAPHIGTTPKNELAVSFAGKVFVCGAIPAESSLAMNVPAGDRAILTSKRSVISWPTLFDTDSKNPNARWKRNWYYELSWKRASGAELRMQWRWRQPCVNGQWAVPPTDTAKLSAVEIANK